MPRLLYTLGSAAALIATTVQAYTPAFVNSTQHQVNSTLLTGWRTESGQGTLNDGITLLANGTDTALNSSYYGVIVYFNETLAANQTASPIPFIAFVSCDSNPSTEATLELPFTSNGTLLTNSTSLTNSSSSDMSSNSTIGGGMNSTAADNSTMSTSSEDNVNSTLPPNVFSLAAEMGASSVFLYSETSQSCSINYTAIGDFNFTIPIFGSPSLRLSNLIRTSQFDNIDAEHRVFNSTLISNSAANLSSIIASGGTNGLPTSFLVGEITANFNKNDSNSGVVATIGRAPTSSRTATGAAPTSDSSSTSTSGSESRFSSSSVVASLSLLVVGVAAISI